MGSRSYRGLGSMTWAGGLKRYEDGLLSPVAVWDAYLNPKPETPNPNPGMHLCPKALKCESREPEGNSVLPIIPCSYGIVQCSALATCLAQLCYGALSNAIYSDPFVPKLTAIPKPYKPNPETLNP